MTDYCSLKAHSKFIRIYKRKVALNYVKIRFYKAKALLFLVIQIKLIRFDRKAGVFFNTSQIRNNEKMLDSLT